MFELPSADELQALAHRAELIYESIHDAPVLSSATLSLITSLSDLTSLEDLDDEQSVGELSSKAMDPAGDGGLGSVAAVCVWPSLVHVAAERLAGSQVTVASVAGGFPSGQDLPSQVISSVAGAVVAGAQEVDIVLNRGLFLSDPKRAQALLTDQISAAGQAQVKVILESGQLPNLEAVAAASAAALNAGASFIKTSTGKSPVGARSSDLGVMCKVVSLFEEHTGQIRGVKASGGIRTAAQASGMIEVIASMWGSDQIVPSRVRLGVSSLVDDVVARYQAARDGDREGLIAQWEEKFFEGYGYSKKDTGRVDSPDSY